MDNLPTRVVEELLRAGATMQSGTTGPAIIEVTSPEAKAVFDAYLAEPDDFVIRATGRDPHGFVHWNDVFPIPLILETRGGARVFTRHDAEKFIAESSVGTETFLMESLIPAEKMVPGPFGTTKLAVG